MAEHSLKQMPAYSVRTGGLLNFTHVPQAHGYANVDMLAVVPLWSFVGRAVELARLVQAANGETGRGMIFGGAAGIGKSRLLRQGVEALDHDRLAIWTASANAATASLPLGSLSQVLPPDQPVGGSPAILLRWGLDALHRQAAGRPLVIAIDDAHLLDPLSATLVYYIARSERATVLATVRTGEPVAEPIRALWTDDLVDRVELGPLTTEETSDLLQQVLGAPMDSASVERLWQLSQGNALLLRELVIAAKATGEISEQYGLLRWTGRLELAPTLAEVIDARIGRLTPEVRSVLEFVTFGEPIGLPLLALAVDMSAVELAEERQLIRVAKEDRRTTIRLAHPLYGEMVRQRCPVTREQRLLARLAALVEQAGANRRDDLLRVAVWRLDSDTARDPKQLLAACRLAFANFEFPLAMRLGHAAVDAGGGFHAAETLAVILMLGARPKEALRLLDNTEDLITNDAQRSRWLAVRGITTYWGLLDESTMDRLAEQAPGLRDPAERSWVQAVEATMRLHHGEVTRAFTLARLVLDSPASAPGPRAVARSTMGHIQAVRGAPEMTIRAMADVDADASQWRSDAPWIQLKVELARGTAMILAADLKAVDALVAAEFAGMVDAGDFQLGSGYVTLIRAQALRLRGRLRDAARSASQASAALSNAEIFAGLAHAERAHIAALLGDAQGAAAAMMEADTTHRPTMTVLYPWQEHARCWTTAARGDIAGAVTVAQRLVARLRTDGFAGHELWALHDLVRLGQADAVADRLAALSEQVEGPIVAIIVRQARALVRRDGPALLGVAEDFAGIGMNLFAAEAAAQALIRLRAARSPHGPRAARLLAELRAQCQGAQTPALDVLQPALTGRERQIARMAAAGVASKEIADRLYLSSRTVDNHLMRVYAKLGVAGRAELADALRSLPTD